MNKKGVELTLNTIVVLILAVLVLVILIVAFRSQLTALFDNISNLIKG